MERENFDINEISVIMDIRPYMFEHIVLNNNEEIHLKVVKKANPIEADGYPGLCLNGTIWYD